MMKFSGNFCAQSTFDMMCFKWKCDGYSIVGNGLFSLITVIDFVVLVITKVILYMSFFSLQAISEQRNNIQEIYDN